MATLEILEWLVVGIMLLDLGISDYETMTISSRKLIFYTGILSLIAIASIVTSYSEITLLFLVCAILIILALIFFRILANADIVVMSLGLIAAFIPFVCAIIAYFGFVALDAYRRKGVFVPAITYMAVAYFGVSFVLIGLKLWIP